MSPMIGIGLGLGLTRRLGGVSSALSLAKSKIQAGNEDTIIQVLGDSTSNASYEFVYLFAQWLADAYPTHTVDYFAPDGAGGYLAVEVISTGTGPRKITIYNNSIAGSYANHLMGGLFSGAILAAPDLILWNYGHNHVTNNPLQPIMQGEILGALAQAQLAFPDAPHAAMIQNPNRDDNAMALAYAVWESISLSWPQLAVIDAYSQEWVADDYSDNLHPDGSGSLKMLEPLTTRWRQSRVGDDASVAIAPWLDTLSSNMLDGDGGERYGDFSIANGGSVPSGWAGGGSVVCSDEAVITYKSAARSLKMTGSGAGATRIFRSPTSAKINLMKGKTGFLTVIQYVPDGSSPTVGRFQVAPNGTGATTLLSRSLLQAVDGYRVWGIGPIDFPADMTSCFVSLFHDTASTPDTGHAVYYQSVVLSLTDTPISS